MTQTMTDPARELAELCQRLYNENVTEAGENHIAEIFGVAVWSREFYEIMFSVFDRIQMVKNIVHELDLDDDHKKEALGHLDSIGGAFSMVSMRHTWHNHGSQNVAPVNVQPVKMLSMGVRQRLSYPKLGPVDVLPIFRPLIS